MSKNTLVKIHEELKELPFCEFHQQVTPVGLCLKGNTCSCGFSGMCVLCTKKGIDHRLLGPLDPLTNMCGLFMDLVVHKGGLKTFSKEFFLEPGYLKEEFLLRNFERLIKSASK